MKYLLFLLTLTANATCVHGGAYSIITKINDHLYQIYDAQSDKGYILRTTKTVFSSMGKIPREVSIEIALAGVNKPEYMTLPTRNGFDTKFLVVQECERSKK